MVIAKVLRIQGNSDTEIIETGKLLQDFLDKTKPADLRKLLMAVENNPSVLKTALKFV